MKTLKKKIMGYIVKVFDKVKVNQEYDERFDLNYGALKQIINVYEDLEIPANSLIHVNEKQMFNWIELAQQKELPIVIFKAECVCDLS